MLVVRISIAIRISTLGVTAWPSSSPSQSPCSESEPCRAHVRYGTRVGVLARGRRRKAPLKHAGIARKRSAGTSARCADCCSFSARSFASVARILRARLRMPCTASGPRPTFSAAPLASNSLERTRLTARSFRGLDCGGMMANLRVRGEERFQNRHETTTRLSNGNVSQLTTSRDFEA